MDFVKSVLIKWLDAVPMDGHSSSLSALAAAREEIVELKEKIATLSTPSDGWFQPHILPPNRETEFIRVHVPTKQEIRGPFAHGKDITEAATSKTKWAAFIKQAPRYANITPDRYNDTKRPSNRQSKRTRTRKGR